MDGASQMMLRFVLTFALLCACGGDTRSLIDGEYDYELVGASCNNGSPATGRMTVYEGQGGALTGSYDVCGATFAGDDLGGRVRGMTFDLRLFAGSILIMDGQVLPGGDLAGVVSGLGSGIMFKARNRHASHGKALSPPPPGDP
jgi:hypothetical protein